MMGQVAQKLTMLKRWAKIVFPRVPVAVDQGRACYCSHLTGKVAECTLLGETGKGNQ